MRNLRSVAKQVGAALGDPHVLVLACLPTDGGGPHYLALVSPDLAERDLRADEFVKRLAGAVGGGGGGTAREAFCGGGDRWHLEVALNDLRQAAVPTRS